MSSISLDNAWLLLIAIPIVLLIAVPYALSINKDNVSGHNIASGALHVVIAIIIAFTAAGTTVQTVLTETDVYVVADVSYSANRNLDVIDGYITQLSQNLPSGASLGIVCFGGDQDVITRVGGELKSVKEAEVDDSHTDIVAALDYTSMIFRSNVIKRIVLITDGRQSDESDEDALKQKVAELNAENIYVDAIYLDDNITDDVNEVQLTSVDCGQTVYCNHESTATALIQSTYSTGAIVTLSEGDKILETKTVTLNTGTTSVEFDLPTELSDDFDGSEEGELHQYTVEVEADNDYSPYNNTCDFTQSVISALKILFISGSSEDRSTISSMYGGDESVDVDYYVNNASVPCTVAELCDYDVIILADIDVSTLDNYETFVTSLETVVSVLGKSLIGVGDLALQNTTDEYLLKLADMLPVNYGSVDDETTLYTVVIDGSDSMLESSYYGLEKAKSFAKQLLDLMGENDAICIVVFYGNVYIQLAPTTLTSASYTYDGVKYTGREAVEVAIDAVDGKHGTLVGYGLQTAGNLISSLDYDAKRIILISDGLTNDDDLGDAELESVVKSLYRDGITTTVIDVGRGNTSNTTANAASELLNNIAIWGGTNASVDVSGSVKEVDSSIFAEVASDLGEAVVDTRAYVNVARYYDSVLDTLKSQFLIEDNTISGYITGYVLNKAKTGSTTVLTTEYEREDGSVTTVPIYAYRSYGNGNAASFTGSISESWLGTWLEYGIGALFFDDVITTNIPEERVSTPFTVTLNEETGYCSLEVTPVSIRLDAVVSVSVTGEEGGETTDVTGVSFNSSTYTCTFAVNDVGRYYIDVTYTYNGESSTRRVYFNISYLNEYNSFATYDASALYKALSSSGTVSEDGNLDIVNDENEVGLRIIDLTIPLLITAVVLFIVDIVVRKLKWEDIRSLFVKINKEKKR